MQKTLGLRPAARQSQSRSRLSILLLMLVLMFLISNAASDTILEADADLSHQADRSHYYGQDEQEFEEADARAPPSAAPAMDGKNNRTSVNSNASTGSKEAEANESTEQSDYEYEMLQKQRREEARKKLKRKEKERQGKVAAQFMLDAGASESCDWKSNFFGFVRGEVCGAHYKVLGIDRKVGSPVSKSDVKKAYRQRSLAVHPDKNPSSEATSAFKVVQDAYDCLSDDSCRRDYDSALEHAEVEIARHREFIVEQTKVKIVQGLNRINTGLITGASYVYNAGLEIWYHAGQFEVEAFGMSHKVGQYLLMLAALHPVGRVLWQVEFASYIWLRGNVELAKWRLR